MRYQPKMATADTAAKRNITIPRTTPPSNLPLESEAHQNMTYRPVKAMRLRKKMQKADKKVIIRKSQ